jgi:hypothetical protein
MYKLLNIILIPIPEIGACRSNFSGIVHNESRIIRGVND